MHKMGIFIMIAATQAAAGAGKLNRVQVGI